LATSVIFKKLPIENNRQKGENSPNLFTLLPSFAALKMIKPVLLFRKRIFVFISSYGKSWLSRRLHASLMKHISTYGEKPRDKKPFEVFREGELGTK
jgi:hypothetical protein